MGYHPSLKLLWEANKARAQLECKFLQETQEMVEKCEHKWAKQARRHTRRRAQMIDQTQCHSSKRCCPRWVQQRLLSFCPGVFLWWCPSALLSEATSMATYQDEHMSLLYLSPVPLCTLVWASWLTSSRSIWESDSSTSDMSPFTSLFHTRHSPWMVLTLLEHSFAGLTIPPEGKVGPYSQWLTQTHPHIMRIHVTSPEVGVGSEHSSTQGAMTICPTQAPDTRTNSGQPQWESLSPSSSPTRGLANPNNDVAVAGSLKSALETECPQSPVHPEEAQWTPTWTLFPGIASPAWTLMRYPWGQLVRSIGIGVRASCKSSKGVDWMDTQMKRIEGGHQDSVGPQIMRSLEPWVEACILADDCTSFENEMNWPQGPDQLVHIAKATGSKIYTRESEAGSSGFS